eukprot:TRINITY_DN38061_c0_g1_i1.p1 TRINITY_DN38061_c0_g1~~TRINITY_DN38061_c0_g1_i1.p1  ORF type:complete len:400 (+),score=82.46 TRINITY_DN38061_c0_g1_i1:34-1233(+)
MLWRDVAVGAGAGACSAFAVGLALLRRYLRYELATPELVHLPLEARDEFEDRHLLQEVKLLLRSYWPHPLLEFSGYTSTAWSGFWAALPATVSPGTTEAITLPDGGTVSLHWAARTTRRQTHAAGARERVAIVLPGLNNDSRTSFIQETMRHLEEGGFRAVALNYRGVGGLELTSPRFGCADSWQDLPAVIAHLHKTRPNADLYAIGFSMGGGILLRYLGEARENAGLKAAVTVAAPVDFPAIGVTLESSLKKRFLNFIMVSGVKMFMLHSFLKSKYAKAVDTGRILRALSIRQLEEASICPLHGYRNADDYYTQNSPRPVLASVKVPTLVINAQDDPVVSFNTMPIEEMKQNPRIYFAATRRGGHIGWGSGGLGAAAWTDTMAVDFMEACSLRVRSKL